MTDVSVTAASVAYTGTSVKTKKAGVAITAGQAVYYDATTGTLKLADANASAATASAVGVALNSCASGQWCTYLEEGLYTVGGTTAVGTIYCVSATAGGIAPIAD